MNKMQLCPRLPLLPEAAEVVSPDLAIERDGTMFVLFNASGAIYQCKQDDEVGVRLGTALAADLGLAPVSVLAKACGLHRATLHRDRARLEAGGVEALQPRKRGPKGPSKLTATVLRSAQRALDGGASLRGVASSVGVSEFAIRHAIRKGLLARGSAGMAAAPVAAPAAWDDEGLVRPRERAEQDQASESGVAVKRTEERALARTGQLAEAAPVFEAAEAVPGAGVLLALPALLEEGLLEVGTKVYSGLRNGFFGLRSVLLTFAFMALLRIKTPEQLTEHAPGELGLLLGLDRAPEVKTLRRKLREMGERGLARTFMRRLTERWARVTPRELALLYVDGHVRPYHGRTHVLPKHHVQQRGRPMPGTKDYHVNDRRADPLFFVTAEATEGLLAMLDSILLPEVRRRVGPRRRVTIAFDREGWSPKLFAKWKDEGFDVLTYRKGQQSRWRDRFFSTVQGTVGGEKVEYRLAERRVRLSHGLHVREIRRLTDDGHQTAVITTNEKLPLLAVAHRMFSRWRQENFFRYMRHEFALDHLCTYEVEPADPKREVANPERTLLKKKLASAGRALARLEDKSLNMRPGGLARVGRRRLSEDGIDHLITRTEEEIDRLKLRIAALPKRVTIDRVLDPSEIVQLERERKVLVDAIKLIAYRAESALARVIEPFFVRHEEESRKFLKSVFAATADIIPDRSTHRLTVRFHGLANPRATHALRELCALVNDHAPLYPNTSLRLHFEAPVLQK
jgi:hypothetical protein